MATLRQKCNHFAKNDFVEDMTESQKLPMAFSLIRLG